ncbi:hypothetical protein [Sporisorium scitamineum]|uniref:Uncharacterized protein n=1 Tax=Sporisorium scitamineum TaxID=49012 RepID=A0A0F7RXT6_9BASI|nr:hypothetical protein [Sporisorium scitamineum]
MLDKSHSVPAIRPQEGFYPLQNPQKHVKCKMELFATLPACMHLVWQEKRYAVSL